MYVLGIETSCDETSAAIVENGKRILSCEISSSLKFHKKYGGVVPEIAFRTQLESIVPVTDLAVKKAKIKLKDVGLVSVTGQPGLRGSLLVGVSFAKAVGFSLNIPLLEIDHLYSHIYANFLNRAHIPLPFISLIVSGGHTSLFYVRDFTQIKVLGQTQDDACGEAFDKVAKILGLAYPGGPHIERLAKKGNPKMIRFGCSDTHNPLNFSFSGIKTAVLYYFHNTLKTLRPKANRIQLIKDIAASFQESVVDTLIKKAVLACKINKINRLVLGGGVAVNNRLREKFICAAKQNGLNVYFPHPKLCMDNAAMVAGLGYHLFKKGINYLK